MSFRYTLYVRFIFFTLFGGDFLGKRCSELMSLRLGFCKLLKGFVESLG